MIAHYARRTQIFNTLRVHRITLSSNPTSTYGITQYSNPRVNQTAAHSTADTYNYMRAEEVHANRVGAKQSSIS